MYFLDTDVLIDILREYPPAVRWFKSLDMEAPVLAGYVIMELIQGCRNQEEVDLLSKMLEPFQVYWPSETACNNALVNFSKRHLSYHLGVLDALIGECAVEQGAILYTFNTKHFDAVDGLVTEQPYQK